MKMGLGKLGDFLKEAGKETYASGGNEVKSTKLASYDHKYEKGDWIYHDTYFGGEKFIGEEIVYYKEKPVWGMNYYGWVESSEISKEEIYGFLKQSLLQDCRDLMPVRGPKEYVSGRWKYLNKQEGNLENFSGEEKVYYDGDLMHKTFYRGGLVVK